MSVFRTCEQGHDLTVEDAYIQTSSGYRACRVCVIERAAGKRRSKYRFDKLGGVS